MPPYRDYLCDYCGHEFSDLNYSQDPDEYRTAECRCGSSAKVLPSLIGGVNGVSLSGARPKSSGSRPGKKVFTGNPGNQGEPESKAEQEAKQMELFEEFGYAANHVTSGKEYD